MTRPAARDRVKGTLLRIVVLALATFVVACTRPAQTSVASTASTTASVEQEIAGLERSWAKAILAKDAATIDRLLADEFMGTTNEIRYTKAEALEDVRKANEHYEVLDLEDINVRVFGDVAVATMDQAEKGWHGGEVFSGQYLFTNVWVKRNGQWRAVSSHGSSVK